MSNIEDDVNELKRLLYSDTLTQYGKRKLVNYYEQRIQELKEESEILEFQNKQVENYAEELKRYNKTVSDRMVEYKKNSIPKQDVIDKIEELKNDLKYIDCNRDCSKCFNKEGKALYRGSDFNFCYAYYQIKALQELLEGEVGRRLGE